ncbi:Ribonucleases P/MRP protein subunit POP1 [Nakaseomyces bracarensis]|uniref:Ribonucleases P/MRP protein subunit POP1 n=1 Tax=Nakaseomyces bracarensis TaxID=273131 RepID=A0ABR4NND8_9SACH
MSGKKQLNDNQLFKRQKVRDARQIRTEAIKQDKHSDLSDAGGMLKVGEFIHSRKYEITSLQMAMKSSKNSGSTRVFQALPRKLRRRTASHNVKHIPRRMRNRALREMRKSNVADVKKGDEPPKSKYRNHGLTNRQLYKMRMAVKLLRLATRSTALQLTLPKAVTLKNTRIRNKIKTLKKAIKTHSSRRKINRLNNSMGSHDIVAVNELAPLPKTKIKYLKRQKLFAWLPTHVWNAKRSHMMKRWGYQIAWAPTQKCFKMTHRLGSETAASDGALCMDTSFYGTMFVTTKEGSDKQCLDNLVGKLTKNKANKKKYKRKISWFEGKLYHPEETETIMGPMELLWINDSKILIRLHPALYGRVFDILCKTKTEGLDILDGRFALSSFTIRGAAALSSLLSIFRSTEASQSYRQLLGIAKLSDYSMLPKSTIFGFKALDPRYLTTPHLPNTVTNSKTLVDSIIEIQNSPPQAELKGIIDRLTESKDRTESYNNQHTLKMIAKRRRYELEKNDKYSGSSRVLKFHKEKDPEIPLLVIKRQKVNDWLVVLPWFWLLPFWYQLNKIPRVYHIGLRQVQQLQYEHGQFYYPDDYPFTETGYLESKIYKRESSYSHWKKKPIGKRVNYEKIKDVHSTTLPAFQGEIGDPFCADWKLLQILRNGMRYLTKDSGQIKLIDPAKTGQFDDQRNRMVGNINDLLELYKDLTEDKLQEDTKIPVKLCNSRKATICTSTINTVTEISSTQLNVTPVSCICVEKGRPKDNARIYKIPDSHIDYWISVANGEYLANGKKLHNQNPPKPEAYDLIGFATSGSFNLGKGMGTCTGFVDSEYFTNKNPHFLLLRNPGTNIYRLARCEQVTI